MTGGFLSNEDRVLGDAFLKDGYVIRAVEDRAALDRIQARMAELAASQLGLDPPNDPKAFLDGNQMAVTYFTDKMAWPWRRRFLLFSLAMSALMLALLAWYGVRMTWDDYDLDVTSPGLGWPQWIYTGWLPLLSLLVLARIAQGFLFVLRRRDR